MDLAEAPPWLLTGVRICTTRTANRVERRELTEFFQGLNASLGRYFPRCSTLLFDGLFSSRFAVAFRVCPGIVPPYRSGRHTALVYTILN